MFRVGDYHEFDEILERLRKRHKDPQVDRYRTPRVRFTECGLHSVSGEIPGDYIAVFYSRKSDAKALIAKWTAKCSAWLVKVDREGPRQKFI